MPATHAASSDDPARTTNHPVDAFVQVDMPDLPANCPMGHAVHELAPLPADTVPAPHEVDCDAPGRPTNDPANAIVQADMPDVEANRPTRHASHELAPLTDDTVPAPHEPA